MTTERIDIEHVMVSEVKPTDEIDSWRLVTTVRTGFAEDASPAELSAAEATFAQIYDAHYTRLFNKAMFMLRDRQLAEDVVSETFYRAFDRLHTFRNRGTPIGAWLYTIMYRLTVDKTRKKGWGKELPADFGIQEDGRSAEPDATQASVEEEALVMVGNNEALVALSGLKNARQRRAIELHFLQGMPVPQVAQEMNIPLGSAKSSIFYGLRKLREQLINSAADPQQ